MFFTVHTHTIGQRFFNNKDGEAMVAQLCEVKGIEHYHYLAYKAPKVFEKFVNQLSTNLGLDNLTSDNYFEKLPSMVENLGIDSFRSIAVDTMRNLRLANFVFGMCEKCPEGGDPNSNPGRDLLDDNFEDGWKK